MWKLNIAAQKKKEDFLIENVPRPKHKLCKLNLGVTSTKGEQ